MPTKRPTVKGGCGFMAADGAPLTPWAVSDARALAPCESRASMVAAKSPGASIVQTACAWPPLAQPLQERVMGSPSGSFASAASVTKQGTTPLSGFRGWQLEGPVKATEIRGGRLISGAGDASGEADGRGAGASVTGADEGAVVRETAGSTGFRSSPPQASRGITRSGTTAARRMVDLRGGIPGTGDWKAGPVPGLSTAQVVDLSSVEGPGHGC